MVRQVVAVIALWATTAGCGSDPPPAIVLHVSAGEKDAVTELARFVPYDELQVSESADPVAALGGGALEVAVVADLGCDGCYRIERTDAGFVVHGGAPLGVQYGVTHLLEIFGFRFFHPWYTHVPDPPEAPESEAAYGRDFAPEIERRGLHLHTIHPIESYYAFWEPGDERLEDAKRIVDWAIKNRANYVQWVGLDDVQQPGADAGPWRRHTQSIIDYAGSRGVETGLGIQLFGQSNLQNGFDLIDSEDPDADHRPELSGRLELIADLGFDTVNLSFGEFFGADPEAFVATVDLAYEVLQEQAAGTEMAATIHVGDSEDLRVDYMNESVLYYFLVKFADPEIVPWVHTVMYYNLFEDAGGAYHHDEFDEHRDYLIDKIGAGEPVGYFPETAYWIAFDVSVPTYLPLYVRSRWLDLSELRSRAGGDPRDHVLFSTGWEWGYWQNDYASLRASYTLPDDYKALFDQMFAPFGGDGAEIAAAIHDLAELQHQALIENRLTAYLSARDFYIDLGDEVDILSQPDRPEPEEVAAMPDGERAAFVSDVIEPMETLAADTDAIGARLDAVSLSAKDNPWLAELRDGVAVTAERARYVAAIYRAADASAGGGDPEPHLADAAAALDAAREIVDRRHGALWYPNADELLYGTTNATLYQWGYLKQTHELCYWERERIKVQRLLGTTEDPVPACVY